MLNESYDVLVMPCDAEPIHKRYNKFPEGKTMWERAGAWTLHISPGIKPRCEGGSAAEAGIPACVQEVFDEWRRFVFMFVDPKC